MLPKSRSQGGGENPSAARRRPGGPREALPFPEPKTPRPGPPYLSCREEAAVVLSSHGGHTLVPARQRVLSPAYPPHFGVETEPEFLVVPLHTRPENPPERSAPGARARDASPPGRGLHRALACALGGGQFRSPGVRSRTAQPAPVPRSPSPCTVHFSRAWAPQSPYRRSQPHGLSRPALHPPCPAPRWSPESRGESNLPPGETAPTRSTSGFTPKPARKVESQIRVAHFVSLMRVKTCIPKSS